MDLLVNTYGTRIRRSGERLVLAFPRTGKKIEYPARRVEKIVILRPSSISTGAVELALEHSIDVVYLGSFGKTVGRIFPSYPKGVTELRRSQLALANSSKAFDIAKAIMQGKAQNQLDYLRQLEGLYNVNLHDYRLQGQTLLESVKFISDSLKGREQLFGIEGYIAEKYFSALQKLYKFPGRKPQGRDKFNSVLNYGYGILYNEVERTCLYVGLDPFLGLYHAERYGKPALVLDLVEEFRVPIVDSAVFPLFVGGIMKASGNFMRLGYQAYQLSTEGKRKVVAAVYERFNQKVMWGGKNREVKKCIEFQVRSLARNFLGTETEYVPFSHKAIM